MAFSEALTERIRQQLARRKNIEEKKMFGGVGFLFNGNMLVGVWKDSLIVRLAQEEGEEALKEPHVKEFDITGRAHEGMGAGRARRCRGRRPVERLDSTAEEVRRDVACEGEVIMSRLQLAIEQIAFARNYTLGLLDQTPAAEWFRQPPDGVSHVSWQVGHLAIADSIRDGILHVQDGDQGEVDVRVATDNETWLGFLAKERSLLAPNGKTGSFGEP